MPTLVPAPALVLLAIAGAVIRPAAAQVKRVPLGPGARQFGVAFLPAPDSFDIVIRATGDLFEVRGTRTQLDSTGEPQALSPWRRPLGVGAKEATIRVSGLQSGTRYRFAFDLIRKPTGNEARQIEAFALDTLRGTFAQAPVGPLPQLAESLARALRHPLTRVLSNHQHLTTTPLAFPTTGAQVLEYLTARDADLQHDSYDRQVKLVVALDSALQAAQRLVAGGPFPALRRELAHRIANSKAFPELDGPRQACDSVDSSIPLPAFPSARERELLDGLAAVNAGTAALGRCRGLLRDLRLDRYQRVQPRKPAAIGAIADLLVPVGERVDELRAALEEQLGFWRRRDAALRQVAQDIRRATEAAVRVRDTLTADGLTKTDTPAMTVAGLGVAVAAVPCGPSRSCVRVVPNLGLGFRIGGNTYFDLGLSLSSTAAADRTRHLFWFSSLMAGPSIRLGKSARRLGVGVVVLRGAVDSLGTAFRFGGYLNLTVVDFRL